MTTWKRTAKAGRLIGVIALIPALIATSGVALLNETTALATQIPRVPDSAFDAPASVQPSIELLASPVTTVTDVPASDIPAKALEAYRRAESLLAKSDPSCKLPWTLVAAIGRVESDHGRINGNALGTDGVARPGIFGIALDGSHNTATIADSDNGSHDRDAKWDRAVGPMQFIPSTWDMVAIDSDNDGTADPQNILDAAAAAGVYLCAGPEDLSTDPGAGVAVHRYNHSDAYVAKVLALAKQYASGRFTDPPANLVAASVRQQQIPAAVPATKPAKTTAVKPEKPAATKPPATEPVTDLPADPPVDPPVDPAVEPPVDPPVVSPVEPPVDPPVEPPVDPPPFAGTEEEALVLCTATGLYLPDSPELAQCVVTLMDTGFLPAPPAAEPEVPPVIEPTPAP